MGTFIKATDLVYDAIIPVRRKTTNASLSGIMDTVGSREAWILAVRGLNSHASTAFKITLKESDTVSGTVASMATTFASATVAAAASTVQLTQLLYTRCGNGDRKRFIGCILSTTAQATAHVGILGFKVKNENYPASSTGFTSVTDVS